MTHDNALVIEEEAPLRTPPACVRLAVCALLALAACGDDGSTSPRTGLTGTVVDTTGAPLAGVAVAFGDVTATTGADGTFTLDAPAASGVASFTLADHVAVQRPVTVHDGARSRLDATLAAEAQPVAVDISSGGVAAGARNARVEIEAGDLVSPRGTFVTGAVQVYLTPLDPSVPAELDAYPGDFSAETMAGASVMLETFGVMDVTIRQNGEKLDVAPGETLTVRFPAPAGNTAPPAVAGLWSFDEARARWVEEGSASYDAETHTFVAELPHLSPWNIDNPTEVTCVVGKVADATGAPVVGARVDARSDAIAGQSFTVSGGDGAFCLFSPVGIDARLTASHPLGGGAVQHITVGTTAVADITSSFTCPATSGACTDVGTVTVTVGQVTGPDDPTNGVACGDVADPFAGTCAAPVRDVFACFAPEGECAITTSEGTVTTTEWDNGAKSVVTYDVATRTGAGTFYGPTGAVCGTTELAESGFTIVTPSAQRFRFDKSGGTFIVTCEATGEQLDSLSDDLDALRACTGGDADLCETTTTGQCETAADCGSGLSCCDFGGTTACLAECPALPSCGDTCASGTVCCALPGGVSQCLTQAQCDAATTPACSESNPCPGDQECCTASGVTFCAPPGVCPG
ncbi:MAG: carboxypeptidase regulatory-like domain-containing protein [Deltaproteobacteria bacterium]|nr:carboxypeptidase regulatory-like domain-containing protein [Deltaproteobacteria bacterium]